MLVSRQIEFKAERDTPMHELADRAMRTFPEYGTAENPVLFMFQSFNTMLKRLLKQQPPLQSFARRGHYVNLATNFGPGWYEGHQTPPIGHVDNETLLEIFKGIPKPLFLHSAALVFPNIKCLEMRAEPRRTGWDSAAVFAWEPHVHVIWEKGIPYNLIAGSPLDPPKDETEWLPPIPDTAMERLAALGKIHAVRVNVRATDSERSADEKAKAARESILREYEGNPLSGSDVTRLPHTINSSADIVSVIMARYTSGGTKTKISKSEVRAIFERIGFKPKGSNSFVKVTKRKNLLSLEFDYGKYHADFQASLGIQGAIWFTPISLDVRSASGALTHTSFGPAIDSCDTHAKLLLNCAALVSAVEQTVVPKVEALMDPAPAWFANERVLEAKKYPARRFGPG
ncbi:MAG TPA: hypothetical protein VKX17_22120 [Planctomycetota bacterium]|nr:hypothetical protein [Planctomycetota bacterium]